MDKKEKMCFELMSIGNVFRRYALNNSGLQYVEKYTGRNQWILGYLFNNKNRDIFQKDLEEAFSLRRSTISKALKLMEEKELIRRESVDYDARLKKLVLTPKAHELNEIVKSEMKKLENKLSDNLTEEEIAQFSNILEKIRKNFNEDMEEEKEC